MNILITGGAGYIGSHTTVELLNNNYDIIIIDNLCNSKEEPVNRVQKLTGKKVQFYKKDLVDFSDIDSIFSKHKIDAVIHFAGLKAVGESVSIPLKYYENNITGTTRLLQVMQKHNVKNIVFSSSATVYGDPASVPIKEDFPVYATTRIGPGGT